MVQKAFAMCCMFSGFACCGILFLISVILIPLGAINLEEANSANPDEDFQALGSVCAVTGVNHCWETGERREKHNGRETTVQFCTDKCKLRHSSDPRPPDSTLDHTRLAC